MDAWKICSLGDRSSNRYYGVHRVEGDTMAWLRYFFKTGANELNWLFLSTSGVHGHYLTLDALEDEECEDITFLAVLPRIVCTYYGNVTVATPDDAKWLRGVVRQTLEAVAKSQEGNL